jgi:hypothetical protein
MLGVLVGIDPVEIAILGVASFIGALGAAILLYGMSRAFKFKRHGLASFGFLLVGSVTGVAFLTDPLIPILAPILVDVLPDPDYFDEAMSDPLLDRLAQDHPREMKGLAARLIAAHFAGGADRVRFEGERFGLQKSTDLTAGYFAKARAEDLVLLMAVQRQVFMDLAVSDPDLCYPFLFGLGPSDADLSKRLGERIPGNIDDLTQSLILNAHEDIPAYDQRLGEDVLEQAQVDIALDFGNKGLALLAGEYKPQSEEEAVALCAIYDQFFASVAANGAGPAEAAYRSMFAGLHS